MHREIDGPEDHELDDKWGYNKDELWVYRGLYAEFKVGGERSRLGLCSDVWSENWCEIIDADGRQHWSCVSLLE